MTAPNHIAGGIVFTGFFTSLYNINIIGDWQTITVALVAMILPDIDHTKSLLGKIFFPVSRLISRRFGHRTITHSLLFLLAVTALTNLFDIYFSTQYSYVVGFGILSHFILDMVTLAGIPLFYPFKKNPCVLPANPQMRIRTGNPKQEGVAFFIFALLALFLQDLFQDGFWTTYNRQFTSIEHVYREYQSHNKDILLEYDYSLFDDKHIGRAKVLYATPNELHLYNGRFAVLSEQPGLRLNSLNLNIMENDRITKKLKFKGSLDSLNQFVMQKYIINANLLFTGPVSLNGRPGSKSIAFSNIFAPFFDDPTFEVKRKKLQQKILTEKRRVALQQSKLRTMKKDLIALESELPKYVADPYRLDRCKKDIIALKSAISNTTIDTSKLLGLRQEMASLTLQDIQASGRLWYFDDLDVN